MKIILILTAMLSLSFASCKTGNKQQNEKQSNSQIEKTAKAEIDIPSFDADSAFAFIEKQLSFGPRVPNSPGHEACAVWLAQKMKSYSDTVYLQETRVRAYDGTILNITNIIGAFNPEHRRRVMLFAHWDTRPWADWDPNPDNHYKPLPGANDGGSGVGVLLEVARLLSTHSPSIGIDIIFFDAEDYGEHRNRDRGLMNRQSGEDSWALGSQYWARNPHKSDYNASYGILLDMVGAENATFKHEGFSMMFAPNIVRKVWATAHEIGFDNFFLNQSGGYVTDDHYYVNTIRNIPAINIIHQTETGEHGFFPYWHTMKDDIDAIDKETLQAVGQTILTVILKE